MPQQPKFKHDCSICIFLGSTSQHDLYFHSEVINGKEVKTLIARYGSKSLEFDSTTNIYADQAALYTARLLAKAKNLL